MSKQVFITLDRKRKKLKGVTPAGKGKYRADIYYKSRKIYLGIFASPLDAAVTYDDFIIEMKLDKPTNFTKIER